MFIGLDLRLVKNKNAFLAGLKLRSFVPAHIRACRKQHVDLLRVVLSFMSLIHNNLRLPPLRIVLAHRLPGRARPASARNGLGRNSDCGDSARHHQVRRIEAFLQLPVFSLFGGFAAAAHLSQMLFGDWFLCHGSYVNTVSEIPTFRMIVELLSRSGLLLARRLDGTFLSLTMSQSAV